MSDEAAAPAARPRAAACWECGLVSGFAVTALLNPWDRALYLSIVNRTPFLAWENWRSPYRGLLQTMVGRSLSSGLYFPLEELCSRSLGSYVLGGQAAGVALGVVLNPLSLIKYQTWGTDAGRPFFGTARRLYQGAGSGVFLRGTLPTAARDATFGFFFALRKYIYTGSDPATGFAAAMACAALGTAFSSPFNYVRNLTYAEGSATCTKFYGFQHLRHLAGEARSQGSALGVCRLLLERFRLGWGTARVAVGMALSDQIYMACVRRSNAA